MISSRHIAAIAAVAIDVVFTVASAKAAQDEIAVDQLHFAFNGRAQAVTDANLRKRLTILGGVLLDRTNCNEARTECNYVLLESSNYNYEPIKNRFDVVAKAESAGGPIRSLSKRISFAPRWAGRYQNAAHEVLLNTLDAAYGSRSVALTPDIAKGKMLRSGRLVFHRTYVAGSQSSFTEEVVVQPKSGE